MAFEGLLAKLGPTLVKEATPHVVQLIAGLGDRFRKDTGEIKEAVNAEMASIARTHAGLVSSLGEQRELLDTMQAQIATSDRRIELLHKSVESLARQLTHDAAESARAQRSTRTIAMLAAVSSVLALLAAVASLVLHR